ncbi:hypothetical protein PMI21_05185 [Pseudomonas sp. GM18]|uniref:hypothetical protein n=1 Tax=Pseudomonas sp. GM18 TaxID=1144324 RepID=UPI00027271CA|nr:hypothetical protein [Pseudomonas sp. GM18]EJM11100.1 hypothetical protein PMI21_05185 [Pseudomonas sp. GM18]
MKIWACAKDANGFINREDGRYKLFFIWQALKLKRENFNYYSSLIFYSTHARESKRRPMVTVKNGWFRYKEKDLRIESSGKSEGESISHAFVVAALAQLETINFQFGTRVVPFTFTRLVAEETDIRFGNGRSYYPDLYGEFTAENPYYKQWGGKVAIEVWVEHECEEPKIGDFLSHGIPIIEVKVTKGLRAEPYIDSNDLEASLERCFAKTKEILSGNVFAKIIANPVSTAFHWEYAAEQESKLKTQADQAQRLFNGIQQQIAQKDKALSERTEQSTKLNALWVSAARQIDTLRNASVDDKAALDLKEGEIQAIKEKLAAEQRIGFWGWLGRRFKKAD